MTVLLAGWLLGAVAAGSFVVSRRQLVRIRRGVAHAEHELRGPLAAIRFAVDLGLRQDGLGARQLGAIAAELRRTELALGDLARERHGCAPLPGERRRAPGLDRVADDLMHVDHGHGRG